MNEAAKAPWHLWLVGGVSLLWNAVGIFSYTMTELGKLDALGMTPDQIAYFDSFPSWAIAVWALGVWGAFFGSVLLLMRSRFAVHCFAIAILGLIGTTYFQNVVADVPADLQSAGLDMAIWVITLFLLWYAWTMHKRSVLR